jgi:putative transposase
MSIVKNMPGRNILKEDVADTYYHIYARGANKQQIFIDDTDFNYFLSLVKRYLSPEDIRSTRGVSFPKLYNDIELLAYCLMQNHFHLLVYQINEKAMTRLMRGVMSSYSLYFNKRHHRVGHLFESCYRASLISNETYLLHISRYIHLNPDRWQSYQYSSLSSYIGSTKRDWIMTNRILDLHASKAAYKVFLEDYGQQRDELYDIKDVLANKLT